MAPETPPPDPAAILDRFERELRRHSVDATAQGRHALALARESFPKMVQRTLASGVSPVAVERDFTLMLGPHRVRGRIDRVDAHLGAQIADLVGERDQGGQQRVRRVLDHLGGVGVALTVMGVGLWSQIVPGLSALVIVWTALQQRRALAIVGALLLVGSFAVAATGKPGTLYLDYFNSTQALHYLLAAGIALLALPRLSAQADASAPPA